MYKIYINGTPLFLLQTEQAKSLLPATEKKLVARYPGKEKFLTNYIDMLEKSSRWESVVLFADDIESLIVDFEKLFKTLEAGGGLVYNEKGEVLLIYRRDFWDLPKGKIDVGESRAEAALREVEEETGLSQIVLHEYLITTLHTYRNKKNKRIIKKTYWYKMEASSQQKLVPQATEDIEQAIWTNISEFLSKNRKIYGNILDVLNFEMAM